MPLVKQQTGNLKCVGLGRPGRSTPSSVSSRHAGSTNYPPNPRPGATFRQLYYDYHIRRYCIILCYTRLHYTILHYAVLHYITWHYSTQSYAIPYDTTHIVNIVLLYTLLFSSLLFYSGMYFHIILQYNVIIYYIR